MVRRVHGDVEYLMFIEYSPLPHRYLRTTQSDSERKTATATRTARAL